MEKPLRVLLVTPYDLAVPSGVNSQALAICRQLNARTDTEGHLLGSLSDADRFDSDWEGWVTPLGRLRSFPLNGARSRFSLDLSLFSRVEAFLSSWKPDVVHLQEPFAPLLNYATLRHARVPTLGTFHTFSETSRGYFWGFPWFQRIFRRLDCRTVVSPTAEAFVSKYYKSEYKLIPNGIPFPPDWKPLKQAESREGPLRLCFLGRWEEPRKGFALLAEAVREIETEKPGRIHCAVAGPGEREGFHRRYGHLPFQWLGQPDEAGKVEALETSQVVVVPSTGGESFGLVPMEAMARGRSVVVFSIRGYRDWMEGCTGVWMAGAPGVASLVKALKEVLAARDSLPNRGEQAREWVRAYRWEQVFPQWLKLYREMAAKKPGE